jgi:hypothetical protein
MSRVSVRYAARSGPASPQIAAGATFFVVGQTERGDTGSAIEVRSMQEYADKCGARVTYGNVYDALRCYFEEGGVHAYIARVVGTTPTVGTHTFVDRAGSPVNTLAVDAKDPGAWSANVTVEVAAGSVAGTFRLIVRYAGAGGQTPETFDNLATVAAAVTALQGSQYVRGRDLGSPSGANAIPAIIGATALSAGTDDRGTVVAGNYTAALAKFLKPLGPGCVAIPGQTSANVGAALETHADGTWRTALLAAAQGATDNAAITEAQALRAATGSQAAGIFHPWLLMPDDAGSTRQVDPVGFIAGINARTLQQAPEGPAQPPAGDYGAARFVTGVVSDIDDTAADTLDNGEVNAIRIIAGRPTLYGWRSLSLDEAQYFLLSQWNTLAWAASQIEAMLQSFPFKVIDGQGRLFSKVAGEATGLVAPLADAGGLYPLVVGGELIDRGYRVDTGPAVNTTQTIAQKKLRLAVGVRPSPAAAMIEAVVSVAAVGATL